jgi:hypothetical protein
MEQSDTITLGILAHFRHFRHSFFAGTVWFNPVFMEISNTDEN